MADTNRTRVSGWGRHPVGMTELRRPERLSDLHDLMSNGASVVARGLGRSYGDASFNSSGTTILMGRLNRLLSFDPSSGVLECEAGVTIAEILEHFVPRGFFPPVVPGTKFVTMGGALACDVHGKNHHKDGSLSRHVLDFTLLTPSGERVLCSRDQNADLFWATVGGMGLTGIVTRLRLELLPVESPYVLVDYDRAKDLDGALQLFDDSDDDYTYSVAWLDGLASGRRLGRSVLMRGTSAPGDESRAWKAAGRSVSVPEGFPGFLLNKASIRAYNTYFYRKHPRKARERLVHYEPFFFPLDGLRNWNRLYGRRGFLQYQFVVPYQGGRDALVKILELFTRSSPGVFLAVLKRFGPVASEHLLSFPMPGYTLALDVPWRGTRISELLTRADEIVGDLGGRVYLGKDARLAPGSFRTMYPALEKWLAIKTAADPENKITSDLARRLKLTP